MERRPNMYFFKIGLSVTDFSEIIILMVIPFKIGISFVIAYSLTLLFATNFLSKIGLSVNQQ